MQIKEFVGKNSVGLLILGLVLGYVGRQEYKSYSASQRIASYRQKAEDRKAKKEAAEPSSTSVPPLSPAT